MSKPVSQPVRNVPVLAGNLPGKSKWLESRVNQGMITVVDPADIPPGALQLCRNARVRFDKTSRRPGSVLVPAKPNSNPVIGLFFLKKNSGEQFLYRFTPSTLYKFQSGSWTQQTGGALSGGANDYFQMVDVLDTFIFANNGVNVLQQINTATNVVSALGNAPKYRYITGFANRVVGANLVDASPNPVQIGWSGDKNVTEWNPATDESAGFSPLVESTADLSDFITGVFGFTNVMAILREQSIWLANKQPVAQNPFYAYSAFPGIGCNCPFSARITTFGLIWADRRTGTIWQFSPGPNAEPIPIGRPVEKTLLSGITHEAHVFAAYDPIRHEYRVCIPQAGSNIVVEWTYNFNTKAWSRDDLEGATMLGNVEFATGKLMIDELTGTMDGLTGTMDGLAGSNPAIPIVAIGRSDGEITVEDVNTFTDPPFAGSTGKFTTELISKTFTLPTDDVYVAELRLEIVPISAGTVKLTYSKDGGRVFTANQKSFVTTAAQINKPILLRWVKLIKCRRFAWRLVADDGQFEVIGYEVHIYKSGESRT